MKRIATLAAIVIIMYTSAAFAKLVVIAPHPDDAEASCGGLIINTAASGEEVVILIMTGGEKGMIGTKPDNARSIRAKEAEKAANLEGASVEFFGAIDAELDVDATNTVKLKQILARLNPTVVLAPWPMDVHSDHQATGLLAWRAFNDKASKFELYFFETSNDPHTKTFDFVPTHYVDISDVINKKKTALLLHKSQYPETWFDMYALINKFRGYECDVKYAEGYIKARNSQGHNTRAGVVGKTLGKDN